MAQPPRAISASGAGSGNQSGASLGGSESKPKPVILNQPVYGQEEIDGFRSHIDACILQVRAEVEYIERVLAAYAATGKSISEDKGTVMRELSHQFPRGEMKKVYTAIVRNVPQE